MYQFNAALFPWLNATAAYPDWLAPFTRIVTLELAKWMLVGSVAAFVVGNARLQRGVLRVAQAMLATRIFARLAQHFFPMSRPFSIGLERCLIAWNRICLGLHFPFHMAAGAAIGGTGAWISNLVPIVVPRIRTTP